MKTSYPVSSMVHLFKIVLRKVVQPYNCVSLLFLRWGLMEFVDIYILKSIHMLCQCQSLCPSGPQRCMRISIQSLCSCQCLNPCGSHSITYLNKFSLSMFALGLGPAGDLVTRQISHILGRTGFKIKYLTNSLVIIIAKWGCYHYVT